MTSICSKLLNNGTLRQLDCTLRQFTQLRCQPWTTLVHGHYSAYRLALLEVEQPAVYNINWSLRWSA